jgi:signal transduction histidine kinase
VDQDVWPIKADPSELELALVNIVINARDAMPDDGVVTVTVENVTLDKKDTKSGLEGEFVAIRVSDTGSGIAPDLMPKVFDPFFTTKAVDKGNRLGLSQVYGFSHGSGGTVSIESALAGVRSFQFICLAPLNRQRCGG